MKLKIIARTFVLLLFSLPGKAQLTEWPATDTTPYQHRQRAAIGRAYVMLATDTRLSFNISGEFRLFNPVTLFISGGPAADRRFLNSDNLADGGRDYYIFGAMASAELRCYGWLKKRHRKGKISRNYSAPYVGLQGLAQSKSLLLMPLDDNINIKGHTGAWMNLGWQQEQNKTWVSIFAGVQLNNYPLSSNYMRTDRFHAGVTVGKVF